MSLGGSSGITTFVMNDKLGLVHLPLLLRLGWAYYYSLGQSGDLTNYTCVFVLCINLCRGKQY